MSDAVNHDAAPPPVPTKRPVGPWGFWATMALSAAVAVVYLAVTIAVVAVFAVLEIVSSGQRELGAIEQALLGNGLVTSVSVVVATVVCSALIVLLVKLRRSGPVHQYLGFRAVRVVTILRWFFAYLCLMFLAYGVFYLFDLEGGPNVVAQQYDSAVFPLLFLAAVVLVGPFFEEVFFRGFMFAGIERSRLGAPGAIVITSLLWAVIHIQYDIQTIVVILFLGFLLGVARVATGSITLTYAVHAAGNAASMAEFLLLS